VRVRPRSWGRRFVLFAAVLTSAAALSPAAGGGLPAPALSPTGEHAGHPQTGSVQAIESIDGHLHHSQETPAHQAEPHRLVLAVDGVLTPEAIPDDRAWAHFLGAMASQADPSAVPGALRAVGLSAADAAAFRAAVAPLGSELANLAAQRKAGGPAAPLQQERDEAFARAHARVQLALTAAGAARLDTYVRTDVKRKIKIYSGRMPLPAPEAQP
jgi:hypothetical protein